MTKPAERPGHSSDLTPVDDPTRRYLESGARLIAEAPPSDAIADLDALRAKSGSAPLVSTSRLMAPPALSPEGGAAPTAPNAPLRVGQQGMRIGAYQVVCELASGGMASVYLALHRSVEGFEKLCAVKRIHPHLASDRAFTEMFVDEAQIAARISHPYVCSVFSFGRSQASHYIAMEFLRGEPLSAVLRRVTAKPALGDDAQYPLLVARVLATLAEGLHAAHVLRDDRGQLLDVVHRDVTPQNLFVMYDGSVRVTDFGIAQARQRLHHTQGQQLKGKLSYIAPELMNRASATVQVDVWGLGVVLWELLAGRRLFLGGSEGETVASVLSRVVVKPSTFRASVPAELDRIVLRALERDLAHRYKSARDLARDLEQFLKASGDSVPAMDVAEWMTRIFPEGVERVQGLMELAARVSLDTAEDTVVRVPSSPPGNKELQRSLPSRSALPAVKVGEPAATAAVRADIVQPSLDSKQQGPTAALELRRRAVAPTKPRWPRRMAAGLLLASLGVAITVRVLGHPSAKLVASSPKSAGELSASTRQPLTTPPVEVTADVNEPAVAVDSLPVLPDDPPPAALSRPLPATVAKAASDESHENAASSPSEVTTEGDLYVTSPGGSGLALIDGRLAGPVPGRFRLSVGRHDLLIKSDNAVQKHLSVEIAGGPPVLLTVDLTQ